MMSPIGLLPEGVRAGLIGSAARSRWPWGSRLALAPRAFGRARLSAMIGPPVGGHALLAPDMRAAAALAARELAELDAGPRGMHRTAALRRMEMGTRLVDLVIHNLDRQSMAASLEARVPFLDHKVVELAARIPPALLLRAGEPKHMLRNALRTVLPPELARRRKRGMTAPRAGWLRAPLPDFAADALSPERLRDTGYFDAAAVTRLLAEHRAERVDAGDVLLGVLGVQLWDSMYMHGAPRAPERIAARMPS
jgi:asparagine synthetase B (glutamine-hydrolysing)